MRVKEYCEDTSLHGFKYLTKASKYQSLFWYIVCAISLILCVLFIHYQMIRYQSNRVTTTVSTTNFPVWKVPFPAVSICNSNVVYRSHTPAITEILKNRKIPEGVIEEYFGNLSLIILNNEVNEINLDLENSLQITNILEQEGYNTHRLMDTKTKTTGGFCCSYNYKGGHSAEKNSNEEKDVFVGGIGSLYGLKVYLDAEQSQYMPVKENVGFQVLVQNSYDYPDIWIYGSHLDIESKMSISVKPLILSSREEIRRIDKKTRGCLFDDEKEISWSKRYTFETCLKNCKLRVIWNMCRCIPFYYPVPRTKFCTILDSSCVINAEKTFVNMRIGNQDEDQLKGKFTCSCPSVCDEITYTSTVQQVHTRSTMEKDSENYNLSVVSVYFGTAGILQFTRSEFISWDTLLASIGGIFGLFLGGSIMSIIEFLFYVISWMMDCSLRFKNISRKTKIDKYHANIYISELYPKGFSRK